MLILSNDLVKNWLCKSDFVEKRTKNEQTDWTLKICKKKFSLNGVGLLYLDFFVYTKG